MAHFQASALRRLRHAVHLHLPAHHQPEPSSSSPRATGARAGPDATTITAVKCFATVPECAAGGRPQCLVKIETAGGFIGWGESGLSSREVAVQGAVAHFSQFLVGQVR